MSNPTSTIGLTQANLGDAMSQERPSQEHVVDPSYPIINSMVVFFLIFATVGGLIELLSAGPDGQEAYALFAASGATIIYGVVLSVLGPRLPARWWGEAIVVGVIFFLIWILMNAISGSLDGGAVGSGALYAVIAALLSGLIFEIISRASHRH